MDTISRQRRRQFIATLVAGSASTLAGCGGDGNSSPTGTDSGTAGLEANYQFNRGTRGRTAAFPDRSASADPVSKRWQYDTEGGLVHQLLVWNGSIYVVDRDGQAYSIDPVSQSQQWQSNVATGIDASPAVADGTLYVPGDDGTLYAVDASSGDTEWEYEIERGSVLSPVVADGTVYLSGSTPGSGQLTALDPASGSVRWRNATETSNVVSPAFADGTVYYRENNGIVAVDVDGETQWTTAEVGYKTNVVVTDGTMVYATVGGNEATEFSDRENAELVALNASDGVESWRYEADSPYFSRPPTVGSDGVYISTGNNVRKIDAQNGDSLWSASPPGTDVYAAVVYGDVLYVTSELEHFTAMETADGSQRWHTEFQVGTFEPVLVDGTVLLNAGTSIQAFE